jgi:PEGA domain
MHKIRFILPLFIIGFFYSSTSWAKETISPKPKTAGFFYYQGFITKNILKFKDQLAGAIAYSSKIEWSPLALSLPLDKSEEVENAIKLIKEGSALGKEAKLEEGFAKYSTALKILDKNIYTLSVALKQGKGKKKYRSLLKKMAIFSFYLGDKDTSKQYIQRYFYLRYSDKIEKWPEDMQPLWKEVNEPYKAKGKGKLTITTDPPGATIYYKFKDKGPSPLIKTSPSGEIILCATFPGYKPAVKRIILNPVNETKTHIVLLPMLDTPMKYLLPSKLELGHSVPGPNIMAAATNLNVNVMVFFYIQAKSAKNVKVTAFLFDKRVKKKLNEITKTFNPAAASSKDIKHFIASIFKGIRLDGKIEKPKAKPKFFSTLWTGITKIPQKKYFWHTMGGIGGALLIGSATAAIIMLTQKDSPRPMGARVLILR